jgi:hypothetical protein
VLPRDRLLLDDAAVFAFVLVLVDLVIAGERLADHPYPGEPFHRGDRIPPWHDQPERKAVSQGQGLSVHGERQDGAGVTELLDGQAALEASETRSSINTAAVGPPKDHFAG